ncbi:triple tyrosine motif-containing protein [Danxiaibacter flavus]|uniref:Triple tyrosine motif-containing protein n=1 Tax=Danxiaibacter flavus TaxID=3049108 RepID=A0ABV3ZJK1_9BACT|nr:triple tyrosine motif-containing protein [Chitinophagaceae bacterium DXS]
MSVYAQDVETRDLAFYSQRDGISNYNIHKIIQDNKKFMWIATQDGLNRFDGRIFTIYNKGLEKKKELFSNDIRDLIYDEGRQIVWAICNLGGINGIDVITGEVKYAIPFNNDHLSESWRIAAKRLNDYIYIATSGGLEIFNVRTAAFEDGKIHGTKNLNLLQKDIRTVEVDKNGNVWCGILDVGLVIYNPTRNSIIKTIPYFSITQVSDNSTFWPLSGTITNENTYYLGTKNGLYKLTFDRTYSHVAQQIYFNKRSPSYKQEINYILSKGNSSLYLCANNLTVYNHLTNKSIELQPRKTSDRKLLADLTVCYEDSNKNIWVGCKQGLAVLKNLKSPFFPIINSRLFNDKLSHLYAVQPLNDKQTLVGVKSGLLLVNGDSYVKQLTQGNRVQNVFCIKRGEFVISGKDELKLFAHGKVNMLANVYREFVPYRHWELNSAVGIGDSMLIVGSENNEGVLIWNYKKHSIQRLEDDEANEQSRLFSNNINSIFLNGKEHPVILSDFGLTEFYPGDMKTKRVTFQNQQLGNKIGVLMDMTETADYYWINAYGEGLLKTDKNFNLLKIYTLKQGLGNSGLYKVFNFKDSLLLLTSNYGLSIFDIKSETFTRYYDTDGLQDNTFEEACGAVYKNKYYAGGVNGFVIVDPKFLAVQNTPPLLYIEGVKIQTADNIIDSSNLEMQTLNIPSSASQTNVYFTVVDYVSPFNIKYEYQINKKNNPWIDIGSQNFISLTGLKPGDYDIHIRACNTNNVWSATKTIKLIFLPKWYETVLFKVAVFSLFTSLLFGAYRYRLNQLKEKEEVRKNIARDLHDDIGSTLNSVKIFAHLAETSAEQHMYFSLIKDSIKQASLSLRDMIWILDNSDDAFEFLIQRLQAFINPVADASKINVEFKIDNLIRSQALSKTEKRNLLFIVKEVVTNSIKYADCSKIVISFSMNGTVKEINIRDNGNGFDLSAVPKGNGLRNIKLRANQIKYSCFIHSQLNQGTETVLISRVIIDQKRKSFAKALMKSLFRWK